MVRSAHVEELGLLQIVVVVEVVGVGVVAAVQCVKHKGLFRALPSVHEILLFLQNRDQMD